MHLGGRVGNERYPLVPFWLKRGHRLPNFNHRLVIGGGWVMNKLVPSGYVFEIEEPEGTGAGIIATLLARGDRVVPAAQGKQDTVQLPSGLQVSYGRRPCGG